MFRIMKGKGGYGFYMWNDTDGKNYNLYCINYTKMI